jgi:PAS domain S-box-containing protein
MLAERALQESHDRYRQLIEASPDAIILHRDTVIRFVNPGAVTLFGASDSTALIGRTLLEFLPGGIPAAVEARTVQLTGSGHSPHWTEQHLERLDGRAVHVEVGGVQITVDGQTAVQTIIRDISERKRAEKELARAYGLVNQHLANTPLGVIE